MTRLEELNAAQAAAWDAYAAAAAAWDATWAAYLVEQNKTQEENSKFEELEAAWAAAWDTEEAWRDAGSKDSGMAAVDEAWVTALAAKAVCEAWDAELKKTKEQTNDQTRRA
jgi:hypothetical protein